MKKLLFIAAAVFTLAACEGPMGPMGPQGVPGQNGQDGRDGRDGQNGQTSDGTNWHKATFTISRDEWIRDGGERAMNSYFFVYRDLSALTSYVYDNGSVIAYIENTYADGTKIKSGLPFVRHKGMVLDNGADYLWTETYDFDFAVGNVGFYLTYSDFETGTPPPDYVTFHVILFWK